MKKAMLLASLAALTITGSAAALPEDGVGRAIFVAGQPSGIASFFFAANVDGPAGFCSYYMDWQSPFLPSGSAPCFLREQKAFGTTSCLANRLFFVTTTVTSGAVCQGFDNFGLIENVNLVMTENNIAPVLSGLALFSLFPFLPRPIIIG
jgi:hypothetical protein